LPVVTNPWLDIPLADYEGHMARPGIEQAQLLSDLFAEVLERFSPKSLAVLGCAGGNGFDRIPSSVERVVGVDLNRNYIDALGARFGRRFDRLELITGDIQSDDVAFSPVELLFVGLVLEYVDLDRVLARTRSMLAAGGRLTTVIQLPDLAAGPVSASPFATLQPLAAFMRLVQPRRVREAANTAGYMQTESREIVSRSGKSFQLQIFAVANNPP
jgi:hypothetical protein